MGTKDEKKAADYTISRRLSVLEMADALGNISEACRRSGMDRTSFYEWKRRFQCNGIEGLRDFTPVSQNQPRATSREVEEAILRESLANPAWGCVKLSNDLRLQGISVSSPTVQKILIRNKMGSAAERWMRLEERHLKEKITITTEQIKKMEAYNPCFKERHAESIRPGELICVNTVYVGSLKDIGKIYLHSAVDTYGSYAFGFLHPDKKPECAATVLHNDVLPFYRKYGLTVSSVLTGNGPEFCGLSIHPFELYLALNDIEHRRTPIGTPRVNGFIERFNRTALNEFFHAAPGKNSFRSVEAIQAEFDIWLDYYNTKRPHLGYRNFGKIPMETILEWCYVRDGC